MGERPLWAPWRIDYITAPKGDECVFCVAATKAAPDASLVIERGEFCLTMLNAFPYASGHLMVAPLRHVDQLDAMTDVETHELMRLTRRAISALRVVMSPTGFNVGLNLGEVAGAGIADHLHLHVVPRWQGDTNFMPLLADTRVMPQALDATRVALLDAVRQLEAP
jgi:ATP adenylyltransferase